MPMDMQSPSLAMMVAGEGDAPGDSPDETDEGAMGQETAAAEVMEASKSGDVGAFRRSLGNFVRMVVAQMEE